MTERDVEGERGSFDRKEDAIAWARAVVANFNATLRPGESARTIVSVFEGSTLAEPKTEHTWMKTNLTTLERNGRVFDTARCSVCGITSKRFGLGSHTRDADFKAHGFATCAGAQRLLAKRAERAQR